MVLIVARSKGAQMFLVPLFGHVAKLDETLGASCKGFALRVTPAGAKSDVLNYRTAEGRERRITIGKHGSPWTCDEARNRAVELLPGIAAGHDPKAMVFWGF